MFCPPRAQRGACPRAELGAAGPLLPKVRGGSLQGTEGWRPTAAVCATRADRWVFGGWGIFKEAGLNMVLSGPPNRAPPEKDAY